MKTLIKETVRAIAAVALLAFTVYWAGPWIVVAMVGGLTAFDFVSDFYAANRSKRHYALAFLYFFLVLIVALNSQLILFVSKIRPIELFLMITSVATVLYVFARTISTRGRARIPELSRQDASISDLLKSVIYIVLLCGAIHDGASCVTLLFIGSFPLFGIVDDLFHRSRTLKSVATSFAFFAATLLGALCLPFGWFLPVAGSALLCSTLLPHRKQLRSRVKAITVPWTKREEQ
jgi:hypothetical protein